ncbi:hypothetical protein [Nocardia crassostreae]|uniref:hypothetical protein n=1 Tax=Nocardia crassostreae TaxID=53428 RepID=UPI000833FC4D|nr:hypothetical protein [Nocardia crassostreae]
MVWVLAVIPLLVVLGMITGWRRPAHWAAAAGVSVAAVLVWWRPEFTMPEDGLTGAAAGAGLLVLNAAAVMLPGVYLSQVFTRRGVDRDLREWVRALPLSGPAKIALMVAGIAPMVEALTGFGVSLLVTVPVLLALAPPATALRQAMLGMNIMPWGTLGLATVIGAALTGLPVTTLGSATAVTSAAVFPLVTVWAVLLARPRRRLRAATLAAGAGLLLATGLLICNRLGLVSPAGVLAGLFTTTIGLALCAIRRRGAVTPDPAPATSGAKAESAVALASSESVVSGTMQTSSESVASGVVHTSSGSAASGVALTTSGSVAFGAAQVISSATDRSSSGEPVVEAELEPAGRLLPPHAVLSAYGLVLGGIAVLRAATAVGVPALELRAGGASFALLSSPCPALLIAALLLDRGRPHVPDLRAALVRAGRPLLALTGFVVLGRLLADTGMIAAVGGAVATAPPLAIALAAPALAMAGGFVTGSNVGGDVLMMPLQQQLAPAGLDTWFAAIQNSGAGHAVFTSLPMIMLILAVAGDRAASVSDHHLLRFGLRVAAAIYAVLAAAAIIVVSV